MKQPLLSILNERLTRVFEFFAKIGSRGSQLLFDAEQLIVLGNTVGAAC